MADRHRARPAGMIERAGFGGVVVTSHHHATEAGITMLRRGGSAVDAAIAANAMLGVVAPETCGIGGDLFALVHDGVAAAPEALNASGWAGSGYDRATVDGMTEIALDHPLTVTVPGCVRGWKALHDRHGSLPWDEVFAPAIEVAHRGFPVSVELAAALAERASRLSAQPGAGELYPSGVTPVAHTKMMRPSLAHTLTVISDDGGEDFYGGEVAAAIRTATSDVLTSDDLAGWEPEWVPPLGAEVFGAAAWTIPPNSQGYLTVAAALILEQLAPPTDPLDPVAIHLAIESYRAVATEKDTVVADPAPLPLDWYLDRERLGLIAETIDRDRAREWPVPSEKPSGTSYLAAVSAAGQAVSLIQSNFHGVGSGLSVEGAGFVLHNRGAGFSLVPGHPNELTPRRRPFHTLAPTLWTSADTTRLVLGTRGGRLQPQILLQMASHLLHSNLSPEQAQDMPRWTVGLGQPGARPPVSVEARLPEAVRRALIGRGHRVDVAEERAGSWGPVAAIAVNRDGLRIGASDPRVSTSSVGLAQ